MIDFIRGRGRPGEKVNEVGGRKRTDFPFSICHFSWPIGDRGLEYRLQSGVLIQRTQLKLVLSTPVFDDKWKMENDK